MCSIHTFANGTICNPAGHNIGGNANRPRDDIKHPALKTTQSNQGNRDQSLQTIQNLEQREVKMQFMLSES